MTAAEFKTDILPAYGAMMALAVRLTRSQDMAADIVQDVVHGLWEKHSSLVFKESPVAFAMRSVRNRCIDVLRHESHKVSMHEGIQDEQAQDDDCDDLMAERLVALQRGIEELGEPRRTIIRLSLKGLQAREIAIQVALSEANVRQMLSRARKQLRILILKNSNL